MKRSERRSGSDQIETPIELPPVPAGFVGEADLFLVFNVRRGRLEGFEAAPGVRPAPPRDYFECALPPNVLHLRVEVSGRGSSVTVLSRGEGVQLVKYVYADSGGGNVVVLASPGDACASIDDLWCSCDGAEAASVMDELLSVDIYLQELHAFLNQAPDTPVTRFRRFFAEYDEQTHPELMGNLGLSDVELDVRREAVKEILDDLRRRVVERTGRICAGAAGCPPMTHDVNELHLPYLEYLSSLQKQLVDAHFPTGGDSVEDAFEMFANGQLRLQLPSLAWACQPSSGYFFFFGEFALLAIEKDIDRDFWAGLAPVLVRAQEIFVRVYGPPAKSGASFEDYNACLYDPASAFTFEEKQELRHRFASSDLCAETGKYAADNMPGLC